MAGVRIGYRICRSRVQKGTPTSYSVGQIGAQRTKPANNKVESTPNNCSPAPDRQDEQSRADVIRGWLGDKHTNSKLHATNRMQILLVFVTVTFLPRHGVV